ncbi:hypothetical protein HMPREF0670_02504 [Prevotella sp. oral taxon 317 str. F0108]|nr:hypothetical protein HMPREF0670_02504 [Prevotella sp. oral taxon 317 str. F0108]
MTSWWALAIFSSFHLFTLSPFNPFTGQLKKEQRYVRKEY